MAEAQRRALPPSPTGEALLLAERMLRAGNDAADRQAVVAARTVTMDEAELRRLLVSQASLAAWSVRALAHCRGQRVAEVLAELRRLAGGDPS